VIASPVIAAEGTVYIGSRDGYLYAINPDGTLKWKFKTGGMIHSTPAIDNKGTVYIGSDDGYLYAIGNYTITSSAGNGGLIIPSGNVPVNSGNSQTFTVTPNPGYHIKDVLVDGKSVGPVTTYTFENTTSDHTIEAVFEKIIPVITISYGENGKVDPSGQITVNYGTSETFTITPKTGYHVSDVKLDGNSVLNALVDNHDGTFSYTLSNITDNHTIDVSFAINKYKITISQTPGGTVFPTGNLTVEYGKSYSCMISPVRGYYVKDVLVDGKSTGTTGTSNVTYTLDNITSDHTIEVVFGQQTTIILTVEKSIFTINGEQKTLDSPPVIKNSRTLLPIRPIVEALGGSVSWDGNEKKVTVTLGSTTIELWIGKNTARVNGTDTPIDSTNSKVVPEIINGRTMLPLRFVTENLGCQLQWDPNTQKITITYQG
jgi:FOG: WD40-like repeat